VIKKLLYIIVLNLITASSLYAGPANPDPVDILQPDGSKITIKMHGDEFQNWSELEGTGHTIIRNHSTGFWEYADQSSDGALKGSGIKVQPKGRNAPANIPKGLRPPRDINSEQQMNLLLQDVYQQRLSGTGNVMPSEGASDSAAAGDWVPAPVSGSRKMLLVLVGFADKPFSTTPSSWSTDVFDSAAKSVTKYYRDNSFNTLNITPVSHSQLGNPDGVVSVTLALTNHPNLGPTWSSLDTATKFNSDQAWGNSALALVAPYVDFNSLDTNGNGILEPTEVVIYFIVAGFETSANSGLTPSVWAHAWRTSGAGLTAGTKNVQRWSQSGEYYNATKQMPMGVIAHELGHQMGGLPDLYDTSGTNKAMGYFSVMASGSWGADSSETGGVTPTALDAWSREYLGWTTPITPTAGTTINLPHALSASNAALKLRLPTISSTEYFLAENRYPTGWDLGLKRQLGSTWTGGMLLTHIDITAGTLGSNDINRYTTTILTPGHQGVVPVQASTTLCDMLVSSSTCYGRNTTLFYSGNNATWTPSSVPNSNYYSGTPTYFSLTGISAPGSTMTANLLMQASPAATTSPASAIGATGASLNGTVNDNYSTTTVYFDYGLSDAYGSSTSGGVVLAGAGSTPVSASISGLTCNSQYHFRVRAINSIGTSYGNDRTFTTTACAPGAPTITSAIAGNSLANIYFTQPDSNGGSPITCYTVIPSSGQSVTGDTVPITVLGLVNGASYSFTVTATNDVGTGPASAAWGGVTPGVVVIEHVDSTGYQLLQNAYDADSSGEEIKILANTPVGGLTVNSSNGNGSVRILGGYNDAFTTTGGLPSIVGKVTLSAGTTRLQNVVVRAP